MDTPPQTATNVGRWNEAEPSLSADKKLNNNNKETLRRNERNSGRYGFICLRQPLSKCDADTNIAHEFHRK
jgi:hypothetical protein